MKFGRLKPGWKGLEGGTAVGPGEGIRLCRDNFKRGFRRRKCLSQDDGERSRGVCQLGAGPAQSSEIFEGGGEIL